MSITFIGDVHGLMTDFAELVETIETDHIIQVGDLGHFPGKPDPTLDKTVWFIDGNHEWFPELDLQGPMQEILPNLVYVPRGTVVGLDGKWVAFLGGGESIDKHLRVEGESWFPEESITFDDLDRLAGNCEGKDIDILVTHTPPSEVVKYIKGYEIDISPSAVAVQNVWEALDKPMIVCGHMHVRQTVLNVEILPELGTLEV